MAHTGVVTGKLRRTEDGTMIQIDRDGDDLHINIYSQSTPGEYAHTASFPISLRDLCDELGILPGDVPADMGYRGY